MFYCQGFAPDFGGDDDDEPPANVEAHADKDAKALEEKAANVSEETLNRMMGLLEQQRLQTQALLAKAEEETTRANLVGELFAKVLSEEPTDVLPLLEECTAHTILQMRDANGLNLLHQAVRVGSWQVVDRLLSLNSNLADQLTSPTGRPMQWSPVMVFVDTSKSVMEETTFKYILAQLLYHTRLATLQTRAGNGSSVLHMCCSKGMAFSMRKLLWAIYNKANANEAAFGLVSSLVNTPNGRGYGCVAWSRFVSLFEFFFPTSLFSLFSLSHLG